MARTKKTTVELPEIGGPGDKLADEAAKAFECFTWYRDLPPETRSVRAALEAARAAGKARGTRGSLPGSLDQWERYSADNEWRFRAQEWDQYRDRIRRGEEIVAVREMGRRHAEAATALIEKGLAALKLVDVSKLPADAVLRFIAEGARLERLARGEPEMTGAFTQNDPQESVRAFLAGDPGVAKAAAMLGAQVLRAELEATEVDA